MPTRYIEVLKAPQTRDPLSGELVFREDGSPDYITTFTIHERLMHNPKWVENYQNMRAAEAIEEAVETAQKSGSKYIELSEEDWLIYAEAAENPKSLFIGKNGPVIVAGPGIHPTLVRQILPFFRAIIEAKDRRPVKQEEPIVVSAA